MKIANIYGYDGGNFGGYVYDINDVSPAINCMGGGNRMPLILLEDEQKTDRRKENEDAYEPQGGGVIKPYSVIGTYNQAVYDICPTLKVNYDNNNAIFVVAPFGKDSNCMEM